MNGPPAFVELSGVAKRFGRTIALRGIDLRVDAGEVVAVLGANGAGKTTLLRTVATLARPTRGDVRLFGLDPWRDRSAVRARVGVVAHQPYVYLDLTCRENLEFFATMFQLRDREQAIASVLEEVGLHDRRDQRALALSRGLLQRLSLARAIVHEPALLILDEPETGLDAPGRLILERIIALQRERGGAVLFTSHAVDWAQRQASRCLVIDRGTVSLDRAAGNGFLGEIEAALSQATLAGSR